MNVYRGFLVVVLCVVLSSCAGRQQTAAVDQGEYAGISRLDGVSIETVRNEPKVAAGYENVVVNPLQMGSQFAMDYPDTASQFQVSMLAHLKSKNVYKSVEDGNSKSKAEDKTVIVDVKVVDMRIVSTGARVWAGAMAGSSFMDLYLKLTDAQSKKVIHEKIIATSNNAFASAWALGSENSLPMDMGKIIGEYVATVVPAS